MSFHNAPIWVQKLYDPAIDPGLRLPAWLWIRQDPSPEAQALAEQIWESLPMGLRSEAAEILEL